MKAYHFLCADMRAGHGDENPWEDGEERTHPGVLELCETGYHSASSWYDALQYAPGPVACIVEVGGEIITADDKQVSSTRKLIAHRDVSRELAVFACDCAEHVLPLWEAVYPQNQRPRQAIATARRYIEGEATATELTAARDAARSAAWSARDAARSAAWSAGDAAWSAAWSAGDAAWSAARDAARDAAWDAARDAAWSAWSAAWSAGDAARSAARDAERNWQCQRLDALLAPLFPLPTQAGLPAKQAGGIGDEERTNA